MVNDSTPAKPSAITPVPQLPDGWFARDYCVLANLTLAVVASNVDITAEWSRIVVASGQPAPPSCLEQMTKRGTAKIFLLEAGKWNEGPQFPLEFSGLLLDRFEDGRWLVVGHRTLELPNARIVTRDGHVQRRFMLGDGIENVAVDQSDAIWVGWFDEGVFGNDHWHVQGEQWPPSSRGIGRFDEFGNLLPLSELPCESTIADCYALTASVADAWICPYVDFPILQLRPEQPHKWWKNQHAGAKALAVHANHALLAGGYGSKANSLILVRLEGSGNGETAPIVSRLKLPLRRLSNEEGSHLVWEHPVLLVGRRGAIHLIAGDVWSSWNVADVVALNR